MQASAIHLAKCEEFVIESARSTGLPNPTVTIAPFDSVTKVLPNPPSRVGQQYFSIHAAGELGNVSTMIHRTRTYRLFGVVSAVKMAVLDAAEAGFHDAPFDAMMDQLVNYRCVELYTGCELRS